MKKAWKMSWKTLMKIVVLKMNQNQKSVPFYKIFIFCRLLSIYISFSKVVDKIFLMQYTQYLEMNFSPVIYIISVKGVCHFFK